MSSLPQTLVEHQDRKCAVPVQVPPTDSSGLPLVSLGRDRGCSNKWVYVGQHRIGGGVKAACGVAPEPGHQWSGHPSPLSGPLISMMTHQTFVEAGVAASSLHSSQRMGSVVQTTARRSALVTVSLHSYTCYFCFQSCPRLV